MKATGLVAIACAAALAAACGGNGRDEATTAEVAQGRSVGTTGELNTGASGDAQHFAEQAAKRGAAEVELGRLAAERSANAEVKQFAQMMVSDHTQAGNELRQAASANGLQLAGELPDDSEKLMQELQGLRGPEFDREYMEAMVEAHREMRAMVSRRVDDARLMTDNGALEMAINGWAAAALPKIEAHLAMAEKIDDMLDGDDESR